MPWPLVREAIIGTMRITAIIFFLAFFLDFFEIAFIILPLLGPVADKMGIDLS